MKKLHTLDSDIVSLLKKTRDPISTREIAMKLKVAWHSVLTRCLRLQLEEKINSFKAGKAHLWYIKRKK